MAFAHSRLPVPLVPGWGYIGDKEKRQGNHHVAFPKAPSPSASPRTTLDDASIACQITSRAFSCVLRKDQEKARLHNLALELDITEYASC